MHSTRRFRTVLAPMAAVLFLTAVALPTSGVAADRAWLVRVVGVSVDSDAHAVEVLGTSEGLSISTSSGFGFGLDLEYRASRRLGVDFGVLSAAPSIGTSVGVGFKSISASADVTMTPISAGLNVHLTPDSRFDVYIGPLLAYVVYDSFTLTAGPGLSESFSSENDVGFGANLGVDVGLDSKGRWAFNASIKYIDTTLEAKPSDGDAGRTDFDPTIFGFGFGYRF